MKPGCVERVVDPERACLPGQDQKDGLRGLLRGGFIAEQLPANPDDHRSVPLHQQPEHHLRRLIAPFGEPGDQDRVLGPADRSGRPERAETLLDRSWLSRHHFPTLGFPVVRFHAICPGHAGSVPFFSEPLKILLDCTRRLFPQPSQTLDRQPNGCIIEPRRVDSGLGFSRPRQAQEIRGRRCRCLKPR